jgi:hypothetical protein
MLAVILWGKLGVERPGNSYDFALSYLVRGVTEDRLSNGNQWLSKLVEFVRVKVDSAHAHELMRG